MGHIWRAAAALVPSGGRRVAHLSSLAARLALSTGGRPRVARMWRGKRAERGEKEWKRGRKMGEKRRRKEAEGRQREGAHAKGRLCHHSLSAGIGV